jgi:hypothetical protein
MDSSLALRMSLLFQQFFYTPSIGEFPTCSTARRAQFESVLKGHGFSRAGSIAKSMRL